MTTVRSATMALLDQLGMTTIFGNPGSTELPMFRDFPAHFRYILGLQESVVIGMADGYAQATRNAAFVNLHSAAGVGHGLGNLFTAYKNQTPLVVTAGQQARSILPFEPFLFAERPSEFPRPYVKWAVEPARAEDVPGAILRAYHIAMQPPCGPVFVSVPIDDWDRACEPVVLTQVSRGSCGDADALNALAAALATAKSPAFVVGAGVALGNAWDETLALAERHEAGVYVAPMAARNSFPEDHRLFRGFLTAFREAIVAALGEHDLIVVLGAPAFTYHAEGFGPHVPEGAKLFQLVDDVKTASWTPEGHAIITSLKPALSLLLRGPAPIARAQWAAKAPAILPDTGFCAALALDMLAKCRPHGSIIVEEAPSHRGTMHAFLPITQRDTFYTTASGGLGHGLPAAIGVALGRPGERVIALLGDGSSMYAIQGLWTAAQLKLPITFIIMNNRRYEALHVFGRHFGLQSLEGTDLSGLDFVSLAQGQGVSAQMVSDEAALSAALEASFGAAEPTLIEILVSD
jgi:benzoylformate decarboxylase